MSYVVVYVTCSDEEEAKKIADILLEERLISCANIMPSCRSIYRWEGKVETGQETVMILKTREELFEQVERTIVNIHSYDCPCIIALPVLKGHEPFMNWIGQETQQNT